MGIALSHFHKNPGFPGMYQIGIEFRSPIGFYESTLGILQQKNQPHDIAAIFFPFSAPSPIQGGVEL